MGDAEQESIRLVASIGRNSYNIEATGAMTWGDVMTRLAELAGDDASGMRLLYKGRTVDAGATLSSCKVKSGSRLMAMKTGARHGAEQKQAARSAAAALAAAADTPRAPTESDPSTAQAGRSGTGGRKREVLGDTGIDDTESFYVRVVQGAATFLVGLDADATLGDLKLRLAPTCGVRAEDQRLLFGGRRDLTDAATLVGDAGAKRGATFMLLAGRRHHDAAEAARDFATIAGDVEALEGRVAGLERRIRGRLISGHAELTLSIGEVEGEAKRLDDNINTVRLEGAEDIARAEALVSKLRAVSGSIVGLRELAQCALGK
jgi:hypothetical protein